MNPGLNTGDVAQPETNYVHVHCTSTAGACTSWTITPSGTGPAGAASNVAALLAYRATTAKGKTTTTVVKQGDFYMSFRIDLTAP
jgi:hypothetical protein